MIKIENLKTTIPTDKHGYAVAPVDSWLDALMTRPRAVVHNLEYGTLFPTRKHRGLGNGTLIDIKRDFKDACKHDPRLELISVDFNLSQASVGVVGFAVHLSTGIIQGDLAA